MQWEYAEVTIPLDLVWTTVSQGPLTDRAAQERGRAALRERYGAIIYEHVQRAARDGWEPDHPTDFQTVSRLGRLQVSSASEKATTAFRFGELVATTHTHTYHVVAVRLRRPRV